MSLVSKPIPGLFNGVSQQPATLRLPNQCEEQINMYSTVAGGVRKRPPTEYIATLPIASSGTHIHTINRDTTERYIVTITSGDLKVYNAITGVEETVTFPAGFDYLSLPIGVDATNSFAVVTIADYSFVVNKTKVVTTKVAPTSLSVGTQYFPSNWNVRIGQTSVNSNYFNNTVGGTDKGKVQTFQDLPNPTDSNDIPPSEGDWYEVQGSDANGFSSYYVVRRGGVWEETHAFGQSLAIDENTMPFALVRQSNGTFSFQPFGWTVRNYGDDLSNPAPSFVNRTLNDVFYYKNRLGFVADENVVFSGASDFGNFFRNTVVDLLDSDVVDAAVSSANVAQLKYAVPFNSGLMLFADQTQFSLNVDEILTPRTVSIDTVTSYEMNTNVRPVGIGSDVYFVTESGNHSRVREYFVQEDTNSTDAADITAHVPRYVPPNVHSMAGNSNEDVLFVASREPGFENRIYVYKFFWNGNEKVQSAWFYWEFPGKDVKVLSLSVIANQLFTVISRDGVTSLESCNVQAGASPDDLEYDILIDRRYKLDPTNNSFTSLTGLTTMTLPYAIPIEDRELLQVVRVDSLEFLVDPSQYVWIDDVTVSVPGKLTGDVNVYVGLKYSATYEFSEQFMTVNNQAVTTGRLMMRTFVIYFTDTAYFSTIVSPYGVDGLEEQIIPAALSEFTGKTLGDQSLILGAPIFTTGEYVFQIYGAANVARVVLKNDSHVQSRFQSAEWEGFYHNRARSI